MKQDEFVEKLKNMLEEVEQANNPEELTDCIIDMLEVIRALSSASGVNFQQIEKKFFEILNAKSSFDRKVYESYIKEANPLVKNYPHKPDCLFCQFFRCEREVKIFDTFLHCYAIKDQFPVSKGHILIIPNEHTENWFTAREEVRLDMIKALHILKSRLDLEYSPQGYNIGANCGEAAGQTIMHLHLHLIPRYQGDMENPKGGVRGVIPSKQKY